MAIDFPNSPTPDQEFTFNNRTWVFSGGRWVPKPASGFSVGDAITTARTLTPPDWLLADGSVYLQTAYPELFSSLGLLEDVSSWTDLAPISGSTIDFLQHVNGLWYAYAWSEFYVSSNNGASWALASGLSYADRQYYSVAFGNGVFVVVGSDNSGTSTQPLVATSTDGLSWTERTVSASGGLRAICFAEGIFVVGKDEQVLTSTDGISWTVTTLPFIAASFYKIVHGNGRFVAIGSFSDPSADGGIAFSEDGLVWSIAPLIVFGEGADIVFGNGLFVASLGDGFAFTSPDGETWTPVYSVAGAHEALFAYNLSYGDGLFIAAVDGGIAYSTDGLSWSFSVSNVTRSFVRALAYGNGLFMGAADRVFTLPRYTYNRSTQFLVPNVSVGAPFRTYIKAR